MRKLILLVGVLATVGGVWVMLASPGPEGVPASSAPVPDVEETESSDPIRNTGAGEESAGTGTGVEPGQREVVRGGEVPAADTVRVLVVDKQSGEPLSGAAVAYYEWFSTSDLGPDDRREYESLHHDLETLTERYGTTVLAGEDGVVFLPVRESVVATGRHGELFGQVRIGRTGGRELEEHYCLELEADLSVTVQVLDARGAPAADVPIALHPEWAPGVAENSSPEVVGVTRATDGVLDAAHLQERTRRWHQAPPYPVGYVLRAHIPGLTDGGALVRLSDLPSDRILLRLPPTGSVTVRSTDSSGGLLPADIVSEALFATPPETSLEDDPRFRPPPAERWRGTRRGDGATHFPRVVVGRRYLAEVFLGGEQVRKVVAGPTREDEALSIILSLTRGPYYLTGRLVDERRQPIADAALTLEYEVLRSLTSLGDRLSTDADGRFRVNISVGQREELELRSWTITERIGRDASISPRGGRWRGRRPLTGTETDLGEIVLVADPFVASGVMSRDGQPVDLDIRPWIQGLAPPSRPGAEAAWRDDEALEMHVLAGGRFEIRGEARWQRYRLFFAGGQGLLPVLPIEFPVGARDLRVELSSGGSLLANVIVDLSVRIDNLRVTVEPLDGQAESVEGLEGVSRWIRQLENRLRGSLVSAENGDYGFRWSTLWPGRYRCEIGPEGSAPMVTVPDVEIVAGEESRDPRLQDVDLRGRLRAIRVRVVDSAGDEIRTSPMPIALVEQLHGDQPAPGFLLGGDAAPILVAGDPVELSILAPGYRERTLRAVASDATVALQPVPDVRLTLSAGMGALPAGYSLRASLTPVSPDERLVRVDGTPMPRHRWLQPRMRSATAVDQSGEVVFPVGGTGRYEIWILVLQDGKAQGSRVRGIEPQEFETEDVDLPQVVEVRIPADALRDAVQRVVRE